MAKRSTRPWIQVDVDILDDERFALTPQAVRGVWITAYLVIAREGDQCKSRARLVWLLKREGIRRPEDAVRALDRLGWLEDVGDGAVTIRGFFKHQPIYRGRSDLPDAKAERNARRPTTRAGRGASRGARGATEERRGEETTPRTPAQEAGRGGDPTPEEARRIFQDLVNRGVVSRVPPILGQPEGVVE